MTGVTVLVLLSVPNACLCCVEEFSLDLECNGIPAEDVGERTPGTVPALDRLVCATQH